MEDEKDVLKVLSARAFLEFEDLQQKYKQCVEKNKFEETKRRKLDSQFRQLKQVSLLAVAEYESLHKQYVTENQYRNQIEENLKKVVEENKEIRKQSKLGVNTTIVATNNQIGNGAQETKGELEVLRAMKDAINNELRAAKNEVAKLRQELEAEQKSHDVAKKQLELSAKQMKQLNRVSVLALDEFTDLKKKLEIEELNRKTAEDVATDLVQKSEKNEKNISIVVETAEKDEQIKKFMDEVDQLHDKIAKQKQESSKKIEELEEEMKHLRSRSDSKDLEEKVGLLMEQLDIAQKQVVEGEARIEKSECDARQLYTRLALAERATENANFSRIPLPPPPPPPPPPIAAPVIRKFITRIGKKKKAGLGDEKEEDPRIEAMTQMIDRIKKGVKLRSVSNKSSGEGENGEEGAIGELAGLLSNLRQGRAGRQGSIDLSDDKPAPEFARFKLKKTDTVKRAESTEALDNTSSELKRKLKKQKSVADGIDQLETTDEESKGTTKSDSKKETEDNKENQDEEKDRSSTESDEKGDIINNETALRNDEPSIEENTSTEESASPCSTGDPPPPSSSENSETHVEEC